MDFEVRLQVRTSGAVRKLTITAGDHRRRGDRSPQECMGSLKCLRTASCARWSYEEMLQVLVFDICSRSSVE